MATKTHDIAQGAAILAVQFKLSPYLAAQVSLKLNSLGNSISALETFACNGFKNEWHDDQFRKMAQRKDIAGANALQEKIQTEGQSYYDKRRKTLEKKLAKLATEFSLPLVWANLAGVKLETDNSDHGFYF